MSYATMQIATPYKGPLPYSEKDSDFFFGRYSEIELVCEVLRTAKISVLLGGEGSGKTSLLRAGVVPYSKATADEPERVIVFDSWRDEPIAQLTRVLRHAGRGRLPNFLSLDSIVRTITKDERLLIILDQFEKCVLRHKAFAAELARVANQSNVHLLLSVRDDVEAELQALQANLPFDSTFRLQPLNLHAARSAIVNPIEVFNLRNPGLEMAIEPEAIEAIVEAARMPDDYAHIDAGRLQRIAIALWDSEFQSGVGTLRASSLSALLAIEHDVRQAVAQHVELFDDPRPPLLVNAVDSLPTVTETVESPAAQGNDRSRHRAIAYAALAIAFAIGAVWLLQGEPETKVLARLDESAAPLSIPAPAVTREDTRAQPSAPPLPGAALPAERAPVTGPPAIASRPPASPAPRPESARRTAAAPNSTTPAAKSRPLPSSVSPDVGDTAKTSMDSPRVFIHVREESEAALQLAQQLAQGGINIAGLKKVDRGPSRIDLRYFHSREKQEANEVAKRLKQFDIRIAEVKYIKGYEDTARNRQYELWLPPDALN